MAPAPALAAFFFLDAIALLASAWWANHTRPGAPCNPTGSTSFRGRALACGAADRRRPPARLALGLERLAQQLVHVVHERELDLLEQVLGKIVQVGLVQLRRDHARDAGALRGQGLLLEPADRQHMPGE